MKQIFETQEKWLVGRKQGIGGSDASAVVGYNPYKSNVGLWEEKLGLKMPPDISNKPFVKFGHDAEPLLVKLFELDHPNYKVEYNDNYTIYSHDRYPFIYCTPDCDLYDLETGEKGGLEIKTTEVLSSMHKEKWRDHIPDNYYCQVLQYFITDPDKQFVWLKARMKYKFGGVVKITTKHYYFRREQCQEDIEWLQTHEVEFWQKYVEKNIRPPKKLPRI